MQRAGNHRPRTKPPEERRAELMNAAQRLFLEHGVGPTTIEEITSGAGVAKGTFYLYFSSKEDIHTALGERFAEEHVASIKATIAKEPDQDWPGKLASWARANVAFYLDSVRLHDMFFHESRSPTREGLVDNIVIDHLAGLLQAGTAAGAWLINDPRFTAVFLFSGCHAVVDDAVLREQRIDRRKLMKKVEQLFFSGVGLPPTHPTR